jgi:hypothetical protein
MPHSDMEESRTRGPITVDNDDDVVVDDDDAGAKPDGWEC